MEASGNNNKSIMGAKDSFFARLWHETASSPATNVKQIKTGGCQIIVKGKVIEFERKDQIFNLRGPIDERHPGEKWYLCEKQLKSNEKKQKYCDFCGHSFCKDCFKSRPFPKSDINGNTLRGEICMIWDRKFIAKDIQLFYEEQIDKKEVKIKQDEQEINKK